MHRTDSYRSSTDEDLIALVASGNVPAFEQLVTRHLPRVVSLSRRMLGDDAEAEDIAQESFLRIWDHAAKFDAEKASLATWLYRIAGNLCIDRLRKKKTQGQSEPIDVALDIGVPPVQDTEIAMMQLTRRVDQALQTLPERQRQALVLCHFEGLKMKEACMAMEISLDALESLLARARRTLKKELEADWKMFLPDKVEY